MTLKEVGNRVGILIIGLLWFYTVLDKVCWPDPQYFPKMLGGNL